MTPVYGEPLQPAPLVLIGSKGEWLGRSLESVLEAAGYAVIRVEGGQRSLELARRLRPDVVILDEDLGGMTGVAVCQALRDDPLFDHATPIFLSAPAPAADQARQRAFFAGAWDFCSQPIDVEVLLLKMRNFVRAKRELEQSRADLMVDPSTGVYSAHGLHRWAETLGALASRQKKSFACVAVQPSAATGHAMSMQQRNDATNDLMTRLADLCQKNSRRSDVVGHLGDSRFAILAPDTGDAGVLGLVERIRKALETSKSNPGWNKDWDLSIGYSSVNDLGTGEVNATDLIGQAQQALTHAYMLNRPLGFKDLTLN
jgi:PleD family two-component response regulator